MKIFIPTRGRPERQPTAAALAEADIPGRLVCTKHDDQLERYQELYKASHVLVAPTKTLTEKRQWILQNTGPNDKIIMLDDDLTFFIRKRDGQFRKATRPQDLVKLFQWFEEALETHAHVGLCDKFMSQNRPRGVAHRGRYNQVMGYNKALIRKRLKQLGRIDFPKFRLDLNQEHDFHLQLLALGLPPAISCEFSKDARYYADGGCSAYRTPKLEREVFNRLQQLWPEYVRLRETKHAIGGVAATFNWRKATEEGIERYERRIG